MVAGIDADHAKFGVLWARRKDERNIAMGLYMFLDGSVEVGAAQDIAMINDIVVGIWNEGKTGSCAAAGSEDFAIFAIDVDIGNTEYLCAIAEAGRHFIGQMVDIGGERRQAGFL